MQSIPQDFVRTLDGYFSHKRIRQGYTINKLWIYFIPDALLPNWCTRLGGEVKEYTKEYFELGVTYSGTHLAWQYTIRREVNGLYVQCLTIPCSVRIVLVDPITGEIQK